MHPIRPHTRKMVSSPDRMAHHCSGRARRTSVLGQASDGPPHKGPECPQVGRSLHCEESGPCRRGWQGISGVSVIVLSQRFIHGCVGCDHTPLCFNSTNRKGGLLSLFVGWLGCRPSLSTAPHRSPSCFAFRLIRWSSCFSPSIRRLP